MYQEDHAKMIGEDDVSGRGILHQMGQVSIVRDWGGARVKPGLWRENLYCTIYLFKVR